MHRTYSEGHRTGDRAAAGGAKAAWLYPPRASQGEGIALRSRPHRRCACAPGHGTRSGSPRGGTSTSCPRASSGAFAPQRSLWLSAVPWPRGFRDLAVLGQRRPASPQTVSQFPRDEIKVLNLAGTPSQEAGLSHCRHVNSDHVAKVPSVRGCRVL